MYSAVFAQKESYELLHLHTDKSTYIPGEILWFKAYTVDGHTHQYVNYSSTIYVQLFNDKNLLVSNLKIENGPAQGSIFIPQSLLSGNYVLKAFTLKMQAQGTEFSKKISIVNPFFTSAASSSTNSETYDFQVFAEGGNLVENLTGKIAYKLTDQKGIGVKHTIKIQKDNEPPFVVSSSNVFGMGSFNFKPEKGKSFTLFAEVDNKVVATSALPEVLKSGLQLNISSQNDKYSILISGSEDFRGATLGLQNENPEGEKNKREFLLGTNLEYLFQINKSDLPQGTSCITLINSQQISVAERVVFGPIRDTLELKVQLNKTNIKTREDLTIHLGSTNNVNLDQSNFSVAVRRFDELNSYPEDDIFTTLYLRKNITGIIENAGKFLQRGEEKALDDLLLTQGWRKIKYAQESEKRYHIVKLKFTDKETHEPIKKQNALLSIPGNNVQVFPALTNDQGIATFFVKNLYGDKQIAAKLASNKPSNIMLQEVLSQNYDTTQAGNRSHDKQLSDEYAINVQAENSYYNKDRATFNLSSKLDSIPFYGKADVSYKLDDYTRFVIMEEVLREYVKEVRVRKHRNDFSFSIVGLSLQNTFSDDPLIMLDGIPLANANEVISYDPLKVEKIEIVGSMIQFGNTTYAGIINFRTYKNNLEGFKLDPATTLLSYQGPQFERVFYTPRFTSAQKGKLPDTRNVLLWNPNVKLGDSISITTSDFKGKYIIDFQGIDNNGNIGRALQYFMVE